MDYLAIQVSSFPKVPQYFEASLSQNSNEEDRCSQIIDLEKQNEAEFEGAIE